MTKDSKTQSRLLARFLPLAAITLLAAGCGYSSAYRGGHDDYARQSPYYGNRAYAAQPADAQRPDYRAAPPARQASVQPAGLSFGAVKRHLRIGQSTQADVIRTLGSPNNMTLNGRGREIWIYDRINTRIDTSAFRTGAGAKLGLGMIGSALGAGMLFDLGESRSDSSMTSQTRTLTVILEFDDAHVLRDMLVREGRY